MDLSKKEQSHKDSLDAAGSGITLADCLYDIDFSDVPDTETSAPVYTKPASDKPSASIKPSGTRRNAVISIAFVACLSLLIYAGTNIGYTLYANINQRAVDSEANYLFDSATGLDTDFEVITVPDEEIIPLIEYDETESLRDRERRLLLEAEAQGRIKYADLLDVNPDFLGMIEIPGIIERQPYVMSQDNAEYLSRNFQGQRTGYGTVFLNAGSDTLMMDNHSIFFGHYNANNAGMFTKLVEYKQASAFESSPVIILDGLIGESVWVIFAAHVVMPDLRFMDSYNDADDYAEYLEYILEHSMFKTDVDVTVSDRIITLSVCDYTFEDSRFLVHARRLRPGEQIPESVNAVPRPQ